MSGLGPVLGYTSIRIRPEKITLALNKDWGKVTKSINEGISRPRAWPPKGPDWRRAWDLLELPPGRAQRRGLDLILLGSTHTLRLIVTGGHGSVGLLIVKDGTGEA